MNKLIKPLVLASIIAFSTSQQAQAGDRDLAKIGLYVGSALLVTAAAWASWSWSSSSKKSKEAASKSAYLDSQRDTAWSLDGALCNWKFTGLNAVELALVAYPYDIHRNEEQVRLMLVADLKVGNIKLRGDDNTLTPVAWEHEELSPGHPSEKCFTDVMAAVDKEVVFLRNQLGTVNDRVDGIFHTYNRLVSDVYGSIDADEREIVISLGEFSYDVHAGFLTEDLFNGVSFATNVDGDYANLFKKLILRYGRMCALKQVLVKYKSDIASIKDAQAVEKDTNELTELMVRSARVVADFQRYPISGAVTFGNISGFYTVLNAVNKALVDHLKIRDAVERELAALADAADAGGEEGAAAAVVDAGDEEE